MSTENKAKNFSHIHIITKKLFSAISPAIILCPANFIFSFLLSRATFLGETAPFGLAASAALGVSRFSLFGLLGAILGYISLFNKINSLKYIACIILIFTANFVFSDTYLSKKRFFAPLSVVVPIFCIDFVFLADGGFRFFDSVVSLFEVVLSGFGAYFLSLFTQKRKLSSGELSVAALVLCVGIVSAFSGISAFSTLSVGRMLALFLTLFCFFFGGMRVGAPCGVVLGTAVSLTLLNPEYCMILALCGIIFSIFSPLGAHLSLFFSFLSGVCICACLNLPLALAFSLEFVVASTFFLLFGKTLFKHTGTFFRSHTKRSDVHLRILTSERLENAAKAFSSLRNALSELDEQNEPPSLSDVKTFFEKTTCSVCKKCELLNTCWNRDTFSTRDAFMKAEHAITKNGVLCASDFPLYFSSRCINIESFINSVNREIFAMRYRAQSYSHLCESRELLSKQYSDTAAIFSDLSSEISSNTHFDEDAEREILSILSNRGILCDAAVYRDFENHLNIHLCGNDLSYIRDHGKTFLPLFSAACKTKLSDIVYTKSKKLDDIIIRELPRLHANFAAAATSRKTNEKSGDSGSFFSPANGKTVLLLSDGMGSGNLAAKESETCISLLSDLLHAGFSPKDALSTLQSVFRFRTEFNAAFSTLDLFYADMFSGYAEFYKLGASPSYIKRGESVRRITSSSLPAGIALSSSHDPDVTSINLLPGDCIIMTSDGIADGVDDVNFLGFISKADVRNLKAFADEILAHSIATYGKNDDMTVAVILVEEVY